MGFHKPIAGLMQEDIPALTRLLKSHSFPVFPISFIFLCNTLSPLLHLQIYLHGRDFLFPGYCTLVSANLPTYLSTTLRCAKFPNS